MKTILLLLVGVLLAAAALAHSWMGERQVVRPLLQPGIDPSPRLQLIIRIAWHTLSVLLVVLAAVFVSLAVTPFDSQGRLVVAVFSASFLILGTIALFLTGPRHIAWPVLLAVSATSALALLQ